MKLLRNLIVWLVVLIVALVAARNFLIQVSMEQGIRAVTGLKLHIGKFNVDLFKPIISIKDLKLYNPAGFQDKVMLDMPEIFIAYKPAELLRGQYSFPELRINLGQLMVVREGKGLNIDALKALKPPPGGEPPKFRIDDFNLAIGQVIYKDYSRTPGPMVKEFNLNANEHFSDITSPYDLVRLMILKTLTKTSIAGLANIDLNSIKEGLQSSVLENIQQKIKSWMR